MDNNQLATLLKFLTDTLQQGKDFTLEQAPKFVQELLMWRVAEDLFWIALWAVIVLVMLLLFRPMIIVFNQWPKGDLDRRGCNFVVGLIAASLMTIALGVNLYDIVKIKVAPRVVIVEMVRDLISQRH